MPHRRHALALLPLGVIEDVTSRLSAHFLVEVRFQRDGSRARLVELTLGDDAVAVGVEARRRLEGVNTR